MIFKEEGNWRQKPSYWECMKPTGCLISMRGGGGGE